MLSAEAGANWAAISKSGASRRRKERNKRRRLLLTWPKGAAQQFYCPTEWIFVFVAVHLRIDIGKGIRRESKQASAPPPAQHIYKMLRRAIACNERVISGFNCWTADRLTDERTRTVSLIFCLVFYRAADRRIKIGAWLRFQHYVQEPSVGRYLMALAKRRVI